MKTFFPDKLYPNGISPAQYIYPYVYNTGLLRINQISAPAKKGKYNKRSFKIKKYIDIFDSREKEVIVGRFGID